MKKLSTLLFSMLLCAAACSANPDTASPADLPLEATAPRTTLTYGIYKASGRQVGFRVVRVVSSQRKEEGELVIQRVGEFDRQMQPILDPATGIERIPPVYSFRVNDQQAVTTSYESLYGSFEEVLEIGSDWNNAPFDGETDFLILSRTDEGQKATGSRSSDNFVDGVRLHDELKIVTTYRGFETIATAAGEFEVQRIEIHVERTSGLGDGAKTVQRNFVDMRAPGIGSVRRGAVDRNGRFRDGYIELLKIEK